MKNEVDKHTKVPCYSNRQLHCTISLESVQSTLTLRITKHVNIICQYY